MKKDLNWIDNEQQINYEHLENATCFLEFFKKRDKKKPQTGRQTELTEKVFATCLLM